MSDGSHPHPRGDANLGCGQRDHIKERFQDLRDIVPAIAEENPSRAVILNRVRVFLYVRLKRLADTSASHAQASDFIMEMRDRSTIHESEVKRLRSENDVLMREIAEMEMELGDGVP
jgi:hypothetical protein